MFSVLVSLMQIVSNSLNLSMKTDSSIAKCENQKKSTEMACSHERNSMNKVDFDTKGLSFSSKKSKSNTVKTKEMSATIEKRDEKSDQLEECKVDEVAFQNSKPSCQQSHILNIAVPEKVGACPL